MAAIISVGGGGQLLLDAIVIECLDGGFYIVELADMPTLTVPEPSGSGDPCDICTGDCENNEATIIRTMPVGRGEFVTAYDPRKLPMEIGGHCVIADMGYHEADGGSGQQLAAKAGPRGELSRAQVEPLFSPVAT